MADLSKAAAFVLNNEDEGLTGKITVDLGSTTRWGIAERYNPPEEIARILSEPVAIQDLTVEQAATIYVAKYGRPFLLDQILDQDVANRSMDVLVNPGPGAGAKILQHAVNRYYGRPVLAEDGRIGPQTISRINGIPTMNFLACLRAQRCVYYLADCQVHPDRLPDLIGWMDRACL